jgi:hypothetical protein
MGACQTIDHMKTLNTLMVISACTAIALATDCKYLEAIICGCLCAICATTKLFTK